MQSDARGDRLQRLQGLRIRSAEYIGVGCRDNVLACRQPAKAELPVDIRSSLFDSSGPGCPEPLVGRKHDDGGVSGRLTVRVVHGAREFRLPIGERDHDAVNSLVQTDVEWKVEDVTPVQEFRLDRPSSRS